MAASTTSTASVTSPVSSSGSSSHGLSGTCETCKLGSYRFFAHFVDDDTKSLAFLRSHGVFPDHVTCRLCGHECVLDESTHRWRCYGSVFLPKKKKRKYCTFTISDFNGTFLDKTKLSPWQVLTFITIFLDKGWSHTTAIRNCNMSLPTSVDWRSFCSEVTSSWYHKQEPIGGEGKTVEIDETYFCKRKHNVGRLVQSVWIFGGIERGTSRIFMVPLMGEFEGRSKAVLVPLIKKFILPGTRIISDQWAAYRMLSDEGFDHWTVNHRLTVSTSSLQMTLRFTPSK